VVENAEGAERYSVKVAVKRIEHRRSTEFELTPEQRDRLKRLVFEITGRAPSGTVTVQLGQGGVSSVTLTEKE
jgi:hypothetical protein